MRMGSRARLAFGWGLVMGLLAAVGGCGKSEPPDPWDELRVALGGFPLTDGVIAQLPEDAAVAVVLRPQRIVVAYTGGPLCPRPERETLWELALADGIVDEADLRGAMVEPLYDVLQERADDLKGCAARHPDTPFTGRAILVVDREVPWETVQRVMYTAGQAQFGEFHFWTDSTGGAP